MSNKSSPPHQCPACEGKRRDPKIPACLACWGECPQKLREAWARTRSTLRRAEAERDLLAWLAAHRRKQHRALGIELLGRAVGSFVTGVLIPVVTASGNKEPAIVSPPTKGDPHVD